MNAVAELIAELVAEIQDLKQVNDNLAAVAERNSDDAEHWKNRYREVVNNEKKEA